MAIAHDFGRVQSLQWCPSGGQAEAEGKLPRLGILAAGCEDGTVRIFSLPELSSVPNLDPNNPERNIFKSGAIITLRRPEMEDDDLFSPCMKVAWFRGRRHRVIAASFADGYVGLWDLNTTSSLLLDETNSIFPYKYFRVHLRNNPTFVDLSTESDPDGFPLHLITGSTDRMFTTWDLGSSDDFPIRDYRRMFITDVLWLSHYAANASVSHDDSCLQSNTRSAFMELKLYDPFRHVSVVAQNSAIWTQSYSPLKNVTLSCTAAGEVILFVMPHPRRNIATMKDLHHLRAAVYRIDMGKFDLDANKCDSTYVKTYNDLVRHDPVLRFLDMPTKNLTLTSKKELLAPRNPSTMTPENPEVYPISSINTVAINTNINDLTLVFSGGQSGLGRVHHLSMLDS